MNKEFKRRIIRKYIEENGRAPTEQELVFLIREEEKLISNETSGFVLPTLEVIKRSEQATAASENTFRRELDHTFKLISDKYDTLTSKSDCLLTSLATLKQTESELLKRKDQVENLLFFFNNDFYVQSHYEDFSNVNRFDVASSDVLLSKNSVTLDFASFDFLDSEEFSSKIEYFNPKFQLNRYGDANKIFKHAGSQLFINAKSFVQEPFDFAILINLKRTKFISMFAFDVEDVSDANYYQIEYSFNGTDFISLGDISLTALSNVVSVNLEVKYLRLKLIKSKYTAFDGDSYQYNIGLSNFKLYTSGIRKSLATLYSNGYNFYDRDGEIISFSKVKCETCVVLPEDTSIELYVSTDQDTWHGINIGSDFGNVVKFSEENFYDFTSLVDESLTIYSTINSTSDYVDRSDRIFNVFFDAAFLKNILFTKMVVGLNPFSEDANYTDRGIDGWNIDYGRNTTSCYFYKLTSSYINFGPRRCLLDGREVSNEVLVDAGWHTFETSLANVLTLDTHTSISSLKSQDRLYPFNHKYLIQGYDYSSGWSGEKVYLGVDRQYGQQLKYCSPEYYAALKLGDSNYFNVFTFFIENSNVFLKFKQNLSSAYSENTTGVIDYSLSLSENDTLYFKAVLKTNGMNTPVLNSISFRIQ